jgi:hypothetical protein
LKFIFNRLTHQRPQAFLSYFLGWKETLTNLLGQLYTLGTKSREKWGKKIKTQDGHYIVVSSCNLFNSGQYQSSKLALGISIFQSSTIGTENREKEHDKNKDKGWSTLVGM